ncbi:UDP-2,4-diacetamido-2,4,6-trideoxy-beta-L-altropyranose hydrolase [Caldithrix abyssi]|nr:UDP-2,4-diacetamido-2,4,6-trideoxy-beta-L-altropyranose hydrolase [Caldithrix abyssi]
MKVAIRADASIKMGNGHVMRCLTLAEALKGNGASVMFISRKHSGNLNNLISRKDFRVIELPQPKSAKNNKSENHQNGDDYQAWLGVSEKHDAEETIGAIGCDKPDWLVVDHYSLGNNWEKKLRPHVKNIMVIDDLANRRHDCDLLLDQNWFENMETRYDGLVSAGCTKLLGPEYALLRPEFAEVRKKIKPRYGSVKRVFVFFGGSDPHNLTGMTLRVLSEPELAQLAVDAVIGENNPHRDEIHELVEARDNIHLHIQVDDMATIMAKADLAIGSGGVNTWERMCLGLPALSISFADNHTILLKDLVKNNYVTYLGRAAEVDETLIKKELMSKIIEQHSLAEESKSVTQLVKGKGRIVVATKLMNTTLSISIVSDKESWINDYVPSFIKKIEKSDHKVTWIHEIDEVPSGDICIMLGCGQIMGKNIRKRNKNTVVAHESALPKGKGWSPLTWQILEGENIIPISLLEAGDKIDSGEIYLQEQMIFEGHELIDEMRAVQAKYSFDLCEKFIKEYPVILRKGKKQEGESTFYNRRKLKDSRLDPDKSIVEQFNLFRVVDNNRYPAFFHKNGYMYKLTIEKTV